MAREYVPIFFDWLENTQDLSAEEKGHLIDAVIMYAAGSDEWLDQLQTSGERIAFRFMRGQIDRGSALSEARSRAGSNKPEQTKTNRNKTEQTETNANKTEQTQTNANKTEQTETNANEKEEEKEEEEEKEKDKEENESPARDAQEDTATRSNSPRPAARARAQPTADMAAFDTFWAAYPNKKAKQDAIKAWTKLKPDAELVTAIMAGLSRQKQSGDWQRDGGRFVPYPATWLNGRRWEDEVTPAAPRQPTPAQIPAQQYAQRSYSTPRETLDEIYTRLNGGVMPGA